MVTVVALTAAAAKIMVVAVVIKEKMDKTEMEHGTENYISM